MDCFHYWRMNLYRKCSFLLTHNPLWWFAIQFAFRTWSSFFFFGFIFMFYSFFHRKILLDHFNWNQIDKSLTTRRRKFDGNHPLYTVQFFSKNYRAMCRLLLLISQPPIENVLYRCLHNHNLNLKLSPNDKKRGFSFRFFFSTL